MVFLKILYLPWKPLKIGYLIRFGCYVISKNVVSEDVPC